ncbi:MAG: TRL domain-containing protein [Desulfobacteraceae bacterium]
MVRRKQQIWVILGLFFVSIALCSCAYVDVKTPYDENLDKTELGSKKGVAQGHSILWLFTWGDTSYATAAGNGNITVIRHADQELFQILFGLYTRWRIVVYGD